MSRITESARGEECQVRLIGVCSYDTAKTIWSHARWEHAGRGKSIKAPDISGAYACTDCDAVYDGQRRFGHHYTCRGEVDRDWVAGHFRSLLMLIEKGLV